MGLKPLHDTIFGDAIPLNPNEELVKDFLDLTGKAAELLQGHNRFQSEAYLSERQIAAAVEAKKNTHYQCLVREVGPACQELQPGDIAILPPYGGTMLTVIDEETEEYRRVFAIRERDVLARFREV